MSVARFDVGVQLHPQATTIDELRDAWRAADDAEAHPVAVGFAQCSVGSTGSR